MASLPVLRKRPRSKREQARDELNRRYAQARTLVKTAPGGARVAATGAKTYATTRWSTSRKRSKARILVIPVALVSGAVVFRKVRKNGEQADAEVDRPLGPVASAETVSPPADAAAAAAAAAQESEAAAS